MNKQEIFDKVVRHLSTMDSAAEKYGTCRYRGTDGSMCAVGCLIDDADYSCNMEGARVRVLPAHFPNSCGWMREHMDMLAEMQRIHDSLLDPFSRQVVRAALVDVAEQWKLDDEIVKECYDE